MKALHRRFPVYSRLLKLYPEPYRRRYSREMLQTTADMLDAAPSQFARTAIWAKVVLDLPLTVGKQQVQYTGTVLRTETPGYIKRNSLIAGSLLLPFCAALAANGLDKIIFNHNLFNSWLWRMPLLRIWVLRLPELAFLLGAGSYLAYVVKTRGQRRGSWLARTVDLRHVWPVLLPVIAAAAIFSIIAFHDSVQCFVHSPAYLAGHRQQTWQCAASQSALKSQVFL